MTVPISTPFLNTYTSGGFITGDTVISGLNLTIPGPAYLYKFYAVPISTLSTTNWLQFFDKASAPAGGATPDFPPIPLTTAANAFAAGDWSPPCGLQFTVGITWALSSTQSTFTAPAGSDAAWLYIGFRADVGY